MHMKKVLVYHAKEVEEYKRLMEKDFPEADLFFCSSPSDVEKNGPEAEIAFVPHDFPQHLFKFMPRVRWVQAMAAGVEHFVRRLEQVQDITLTKMVAVDAVYMAEYVMAYILFFSQEIARILKAQRAKLWEPYPMEFIHNKTCGIMGLGAIGVVIAEKAKAMGMRVVSWDLSRKDAPFVDKQYMAQDLSNFLRESDYVVVVLPVTPATVNLIDMSVLEGMQKGSYLINVCRGEVVDETALVRALRTGMIAGAVLDVFKEEPLPPESELWDCPNLILTPHISGAALPPDMVNFFKDNFLRYLGDEPLEGVVDFDLGF
jgi:phosphoglycerate dehydrogenase-like enzyme